MGKRLSRRVPSHDALGDRNRTTRTMIQNAYFKRRHKAPYFCQVPGALAPGNSIYPEDCQDAGPGSITTTRSSAYSPLMPTVLITLVQHSFSLPTRAT